MKAAVKYDIYIIRNIDSMNVSPVSYTHLKDLKALMSDLKAVYAAVDLSLIHI